MFSLLKKKITDEILFNKLGPKFYIRNGIGYGFVSDQLLYDNSYLEIGFGRIYSGYGDWGGGFDRASDSAIKMIIDKDLKIIKSLVGYYTGCDTKTYRTAQELHRRLKTNLVVKNPVLLKILHEIFSHLPVKKHIGLDGSLDDIPHTNMMLNYFLNEAQSYKQIKDADSKNAPMGTYP